MSTYIDKKFINMVSPQLEKFKWKKIISAKKLYNYDSLEISEKGNIQV